PTTSRRCSWRSAPPGATCTRTTSPSKVSGGTWPSARCSSADPGTRTGRGQRLPAAGPSAHSAGKTTTGGVDLLHQVVVVGPDTGVDTRVARPSATVPPRSHADQLAVHHQRATGVALASVDRKSVVQGTRVERGGSESG